MKTRVLKITVLAAWLICLSGLVFHRSFPAEAQTKSNANARPRKPDVALIDKFDNEIKARFLTAPFFGIARIAPSTPQPLRSGHLSGFAPIDQNEAASVKQFNDDGWNVGIYLYGRRTEPKLKDGRPVDKFNIKYRVNRPVPVTFGLKETQLQEPADLVRYVKLAFLEYQKAEPGTEKGFEFENGDWSYVARPVRAVNESCLKCHNDYVVTDKLGNGKVNVRKRRVGDVNGILLYAFRKKK
jgi:hypothetical protein